MDKLIILALFALCAVLLISASGPSSPPAPPTPTPDSVALTLAQIAAQDSQSLNKIALDAHQQDLDAAHPAPEPSELERTIKLLAIPLAVVTIVVGIVAITISLLIMWNIRDKRRAEIERQRLAVQVAQGIPELKAILESLREYQQGADVTPRNTEENENEHLS